MSKDVKIELIYFKSNTDVSLEFGLHGEYPLRLLSTSAKSLTDFFHALKRAVSRSEIIILIGGYTSDEYLPDFLSKAIGRTPIECDNGDYGILAPGTVKIPAGAIPLVTKGKFGGFIIESGPQTIFSLTDDRDLRLAITKDIIVNYITEHHKAFGGTVVIAKDIDKVEDNANENIVESIETDHKNTKDNEQNNDDNNVGSNEFTDISSSSSNTAEQVESIEKDEPVRTVFIPSRDIPTNENSTDEVISDDENAITESEVEIENDDDTTEAMTDEVPSSNKDVEKPLSIDADEFIFDKSTKSKAKPRHESKIIRILCIILSVLVVLSTVGFILVYPKLNDKDYYSAMASIYNNYKDDPSAAFNKIKNKDNKVFTWLEIEELNVFHPAITIDDASITSNYLNTLPNGEIGVLGSLISITNTSPNIATSNTIIYGSAKVGGIFEGMTKFTEGSVINIGDVIKTADNRYQAEWSVFSYLEASDDDVISATETNFSDSASYLQYLNTLLSNSIKKCDATFLGNEKLIILVGVADNKNYIIAANLSSVRVLSGNTANLNSSYTQSTSSNNTSSEETVSGDPIVSEPENHPEVEGEDFYGDSPDIILPPPVSDVSSAVTSTESSKVSSSSEVSTTESSKNSSVNSSSSKEPSTESSSEEESSSSEEQISSENSSVTTTSSEVSWTENSSSVISSTPPSPPVDPIYTWDKEFTITDTATGIKYTAKAVDMVAMIIEDEMSPTIDPAEAVIAQAIVKYNWLLHNNGNKNALDPNPTPQAKMYAEAAKGSVIMYGNTLAKTYCYAYSAGKTACYQDIWGGTAYPYLQSVDCPVDEELKDFITTSTYSAELISKIIKDKCGIDVTEMPKTEWLKPIQFDKNNLYCLKISIGGKEYNGRYLRETMLTKANTNIAQIRSTAYTITYNETDNTFTISCKGYGHGVGLSQRGAKAYAKLGWTHEQIIAHFFPGTTIVKH